MIELKLIIGILIIGIALAAAGTLVGRRLSRRIERELAAAPFEPAYELLPHAMPQRRRSDLDGTPARSPVEPGAGDAVPKWAKGKLGEPIRKSALDVETA